MLTHRNLLAMTLNYLADVDRAAVGDHLLHAAPMSHGSGLYTIPNVAAGATQVIPAARGFDVDEILQILAYTPSDEILRGADDGDAAGGRLCVAGFVARAT